jgi:hypothetical protein
LEYITVEQLFHGGKDLIFRDPLADHVPQTLGTGFGRQGNRLDPHLTKERRHLGAQAIETQGADCRRSPLGDDGAAQGR